MLDIIEDLGITDERILCAHYSRGFMYMSVVIEEHDPTTPLSTLSSSTCSSEWIPI